MASHKAKRMDMPIVRRRDPSVFKLYGHAINVEYSQLKLEVEPIFSPTLVLNFYDGEDDEDRPVFTSSWASIPGMERFVTNLQRVLKDESSEARFDVIGLDQRTRYTIRMTAVMTKQQLSVLISVLNKSIQDIEKYRLRKALEEIDSVQSV